MKAILVLDVDEKYIGSIGTEIQFINQKYNCEWKLKPLPKMSGLVHQDTDGWCELSEYGRGWNDCLDEIFGD